MGQLVDGELVAAVGSLDRARAARALPELDALAGLVALQGGETAAALRQLDAAIARRSEAPLVFYWAGRAALAAGRPAQAVSRMEQALAVGGDQPLLRMGHALALLAAGARPRAEASLLLVAGAEPNLLDPSLFPTPTEGAIELLGAVLRGFPPVELQRSQGHLLYRSGRVLAALRRFQALALRSAADADALQMLARCLHALGLRDDALAMASRALKAAPDSPQAHAARGELLLEAGQPAKAIDDLRRAADGLPRDARLLVRLADACAAAERSDCARRFYGYAASRDRGLAAAHFGLALLAQQAGRVAEAHTALQRALELEPGSSRYHFGAAHLAREQGQRALAVREQAEARRAEAVERQHQQRTRATLEQAARVVRAQRELARSPTCDTRCQAAVSRLPERPRGWLRAHLAWKGGDRQLAKQLLAGVVGALRPDLLTRDPTLLKTPGKTGAGRTYVLRTILPLVPAHRLP